MNVVYLLIPLFFIALIVWVAWPLMTEGEGTAPVETKRSKKRGK